MYFDSEQNTNPLIPMSICTDYKMHMNPQLRSKFFGTSLELRQQIYGYLIPDGVHVSFRQGNFSLSVCVQPDPNNSFDGNERRGLEFLPTPIGTPDPLWMQRLRSTWGPHWECEEVALHVHNSLEYMRGTRLNFLQAR